MKKYSELNNGARFNVAMHTIKPLNGDKDLNYKYCLRFYQYNSRKNAEFIKDSDIECHEATTNTYFQLQDGKMISADTGLFFYGGYVDETLGSYIEPKILCEYFKEAALSKEKGKTLEMKKNI